jgi:hypothetical protein
MCVCVRERVCMYVCVDVRVLCTREDVCICVCECVYLCVYMGVRVGV